MSYLSTLRRNFLHSGSHFHCLHTLLSFPYATQGSFVFLLIFSTAFIPSQRCAVARTPNAPHSPHQGLRSATTELPFKIYLLVFPVFRGPFLSSFHSPEPVHVPAADRPRRHIATVPVCLLLAQPLQSFHLFLFPLSVTPGCD